MQGLNNKIMLILPPHSFLSLLSFFSLIYELIELYCCYFEQTSVRSIQNKRIIYFIFTYSFSNAPACLCRMEFDYNIFLLSKELLLIFRVGQFIWQQILSIFVCLRKYFSFTFWRQFCRIQNSKLVVFFLSLL